MVLAALTPPGLLAGALAGGVLGGLHHKGLGVDSAERDQIADALSSGQAAVGALVAQTEASALSDKLTELGGELHVLSPTDEAVAEVDTAAPQVEAAEAQEPERTTPAQHLSDPPAPTRPRRTAMKVAACDEATDPSVYSAGNGHVGLAGWSVRSVDVREAARPAMSAATSTSLRFSCCDCFRSRWNASSGEHDNAAMMTPLACPTDVAGFQRVGESSPARGHADHLDDAALAHGARRGAPLRRCVAGSRRSISEVCRFSVSRAPADHLDDVVPQRSRTHASSVTDDFLHDVAGTVTRRVEKAPALRVCGRRRTVQALTVQQQP